MQMIVTGVRSLSLIKMFSFAVYWLVLVPIGFLWNLLNRDGFCPGIDKKVDTYWLPRRDIEKPTVRYRRQF